MLQDTKSNSRTGTIRGWLSDSAKGWWELIRINIFLIVFAQYCIEAFLLYDTQWYRNNYILIDRIDTIVVSLAVMDAFFNKVFYKYSDSNLIAFALFVFILLIQILGSSGYINPNVYINLFKGTLIAGGIVFGFLLIEKIFK